MKQYKKNIQVTKLQLIFDGMLFGQVPVYKLQVLGEDGIRYLSDTTFGPIGAFPEKVSADNDKMTNDDEHEWYG